MMKSSGTLGISVKRITYHVSRFTFFIFCLLFLANCRPEYTTWKRIEQTGVLRVGLDPTYPPFEVVDDSGLQGLDVDLAQAIAADLGLEAEFVYFGYDGLYDALATEQVDVLASALVIAPERMRDFAYTEPYFNAGEILIVPQSETEIAGMKDLNGRTLAVELGALGHVEANTWAKRLSNLTILPLGSAADAVTAVAQNQAGAALVDAISGQLALQEQPSLKRLPDPVTVEPFALVVRIDDESLLEKLNESLENLSKSGQLQNIIDKWLG
ncbi:MAG: amino acid ABC transporter substrate-binding protein [Ardenticatenaceae bacterium]|nr:amino acid ABC transporter substrate-binding protein [Ardenticatenaceae bacterium]MCB9442998.1 amino acid ABC transporter substrate-binding protein [Ardenticatenaceae bacterium]